MRKPRLSVWAIAAAAMQFIVACSGGSSSGSSDVVQPEGEPRQWIVYTLVNDPNSTTPQSDILAVREDGNERVVLANDPEPEVFAAVTKDRRVIYHKRVGYNDDDIYIVNLDGTHRTALVTGPTFDRFVALTPSGRMIFSRWDLAAFHALYSINLDGSDERILTDGVGLKLFRAVSDDGHVIFDLRSGNLPDGTYSVNEDGTGFVSLLMTTAGLLESRGDIAYFLTQDPYYEIIAVNINDGSKTVLAGQSQDAEFVGLGSERLVYAYIDLGMGVKHLRSMRLDGSDDIPLIDVEATASTRIFNDSVIYAIDNGGQLDIYAVSVEGGAPLGLATSMLDEAPLLTDLPSGRVLYSTTNGMTREFHSVLVDGGGDVQLTNANMVQSPYFITPSGYVVFSRSVYGSSSGEWSVNAIPIAGGPERELAPTYSAQNSCGATQADRYIYRRSVTPYSMQDEIYAVGIKSGFRALLANGGHLGCNAIL